MRAYEAAAGAGTRAIDLLHVRCQGLDGRPVERFGYLIVSLGGAATISHRTSQSRWLKKLGGIAYLLMTPPVTLGYRSRDVAITIDGVADGTRPIFTAMVANTENGGGGMRLMAVVGAQREMGPFYFAGLAIALVCAVYHWTLIRGRDRDRCFRAFLHNHWFGLAVFAGIALDRKSVV